MPYTPPSPALSQIFFTPRRRFDFRALFAAHIRHAAIITPHYVLLACCSGYVPSADASCHIFAIFDYAVFIR